MAVRRDAAGGQFQQWESAVIVPDSVGGVNRFTLRA
jgi:hypothetical protein